MTTISFRRFCAAVLISAGALMTSAAHAAKVPGPLSFACQQNTMAHPSDFLTYTLRMKFPTTGYHLTLSGSRLQGKIVNLAVHFTLDAGAHGDMVTTEKVQFTMIAPKFPKLFTVTANGKLLGAARAILPPPHTANPG
jgi:hypothetical protein